MALSIGLNAAQRHYFFKSGHLILHGVLSQEQSSLLAQDIVATWSKRLCGKRDSQLPAQARQSGRDLWRDTQNWSSKLLRLPIGSLALQLWSRTSLRLLFDQLLFPLPAKHDAYGSFSLLSASAFGGIEGGVLICLQSPKVVNWHLSLETLVQDGPDQKVERVALAHEVGTAVFITSGTLIKIETDFHQLPPTSGVWMLAGFGGADARYIFNLGDPSRHALSAFNYTIGERLTDATHPLIKTSGGATMR